jgi:hypothetical protein
LSRWDDEYTNHAVWITVDRLRDTLDGCPPTDDVAQREHLDRLRRLVIELDARRELDGMVVSRPLLDTINTTITTMLDQVTNYINQPANWPSYLGQAAVGQADQVFALLMQMPQPGRDAQIAASRAAAKAYRDAADEFIQEVRDRAGKAIAAVEEDRESYTAATERGLAEVERLSNAVVQADARVTEQVTRLESSLTAHQSAFEIQQGERSDRFQKDLDAFREKSEQQLAATQEAAMRHSEAEREIAEQTLAQLERLHEEAKAVVEATGRRAVTTEFGEYAKKQDHAAFGWSLAAIALALGGFVFIAIQIATLDAHDLSWELAAYKITASVALLLVAGFAAKQSAGHREQEKQAKRRQLEINALEPFLARLPDEQAEALRVKMADRILVQPAPEAAETSTSGLPTTEDIGTMLGAALREATGKKGA